MRYGPAATPAAFISPSTAARTWRDVTPPSLSAWSKISLIEASHFDPGTAYAAVDRHRLDDQKPYLYITHDYGKTWKLSVDGIASHHFVRAVREDTEQKNLLFAGTEFGIYASFDGGDHWQSLQLNLPVSSVRDININGSDLIVATHGRSFWVLDDIAPLRQAAAANEHGSSAYLYAPPTAVRVDNDGFLGTPLPPEEPQADNPPNGAIVDYYLGQNATKVTLQILDAQGHVIRHFSSAEKQTVQPPAAADSRTVVSEAGDARDRSRASIVSCGILPQAAPAQAWATMTPTTQSDCRRVRVFLLATYTCCSPSTETSLNASPPRHHGSARDGDPAGARSAIRPR